MIHKFNRKPEPNRNRVMNIHQLMKPTTILTQPRRPVADNLLCAIPKCAILLCTISSLPIWMILAVQSIGGPPRSGALAGAEIGFRGLVEITRWPRECGIAPSTVFCPSITRSLTSCRAYVVACTRAVFACVAFESINVLSANHALRRSGSFVVFPSHVCKDSEIDADYIAAARKRLADHQAQPRLFDAKKPTNEQQTMNL